MTIQEDGSLSYLIFGFLMIHNVKAQLKSVGDVLNSEMLHLLVLLSLFLRVLTGLEYAGPSKIWALEHTYMQLHHDNHLGLPSTSRIIVSIHLMKMIDN